MHKMLVFFLISGLIGLGILSPQFIVILDLQPALFSNVEQQTDSVPEDEIIPTTIKIGSPDIPEVGHEPLPPPPPPPPDDDGYVLADPNPDIP